MVYELHVRAFLDSNGDGIGDFRGLTEKLDYLRDLGVSAIWLLPFYPSPLKDDGYDIADYYSINPIYGTLKDFKVFLAEARARNLRVITELVVNHTSDQHPWFQRSRRSAPGSPWRDFYVWSDTPDRYSEARIIFRDFELSNWSWDPVAHAYYWHRFYSHQPDLNYENPLVHKEIERVLDFWLDLGVDGLRLDAVPYLYEREGSSCENLPETHAYLKKLRRHVDEKYGDRMLLAEANQWPEDAVSYFGSGKGDECHMAFHFPLMPRIFMALRMEDRVPIVDILEQTPAIPETSQWALFLRNHDELTLEMVTDEERDYMYRVYAHDAKARINLGIRRRLAPLLGNDRKRLELLKLLLFSLPGTPVLYYGDEIGMGDNVFLGDRNGVRTPMQWSSDKNAGFSRASPHALFLPIILDPEYHYEAVNVEAQQQNPNSLLWWTKRTLALRKRHQAFGRGTLEFLQPENRKILAFIRRYKEEVLLVVANLCRFTQPVRIDLSAFRETVPVELFGRAQFPAITEAPYFMTLSPHTAFWFSLEPSGAGGRVGGDQTSSEIALPEDWERLGHENWRHGLETRLWDFVREQPWFLTRGRQVKSVQITELVSLPAGRARAYLLVLLLEYTEGEVEQYLLPVLLAEDQGADSREPNPGARLIARARLEPADRAAMLLAACDDKSFGLALLEAIARRRWFKGLNGEVRAIPHAATASELAGEIGSLQADRSKQDQSNAVLVFGNKYVLKLFRRLESGANPDLELSRFLTEKRFPNIAPLAGWLEYQGKTGEEFTFGMLTRYVQNGQGAWDYTLDALNRYLERAGGAPKEWLSTVTPQESLLRLSERRPSEPMADLLGTYLEMARLLGQRTAELHLALGSDPQTREFAPEAFTPFYQRALFQSMRNLTVQTFDLLRSRLDRLPPETRAEAQRVVSRQWELVDRLRALTETRLRARRIRCHGDLHLGQVLFTGKDFVFIDFEGETFRALGERRIKRSPLRDVAGMLRSFDYISYMGLCNQIELGAMQEQDLPRLEPWTGLWQRWVSAVYLNGYLKTIKGSDFLPSGEHELAVLLDAHLAEKAVYEINYELHHRPHWTIIPLRGITRLLDSDSVP